MSFPEKGNVKEDPELFIVGQHANRPGEELVFSGASAERERHAEGSQRAEEESGEFEECSFQLCPRAVRGIAGLISCFMPAVYSGRSEVVWSVSR